MEQRYKDALRQIYKDKLNPSKSRNDYVNALFASAQSYRLMPSTVATTKVNTSTESPETIGPSKVTEKTLILDSLHQFGKDKIEQSGETTFPVEGGEISVKESSDSDSSATNKFELELKKLQDLLEKRDSFGQVFLSDRISEKNANNIKVIFVSDSFVNEVSAEELQTDKEFYTLFEGSTAVMFSKMVKAMNLGKDEFALSAVKTADDTDYFQLLLSEIYELKPSLVVTMGITASESLLQLNKRLKEIHGKFYKAQINDFTTEVMPLFSPNLLSSAVNMKKIAWEDMQKAMSFLNS